MRSQYVAEHRHAAVKLTQLAHGADLVLGEQPRAHLVDPDPATES
jgi:hypothetical protein